MDKIKENLYKNIDMLNTKNSKIHNIRENGKLISRKYTKEIEITNKEDKPGIIIKVKKGTKNKTVQIPVIVTDPGFNDFVYNDFLIEDNSEVTIYAGCAIHNDCDNDSSHSGIHTFKIGKNAKVKYIEKHFGCGTFSKKTINTDTIIYLGESSELSIETTQIGGLEKANRKTSATLNQNSSLNIDEKLLTSDKENIKTSFNVKLLGKDSKCNIISKSIAKDNSKQEFTSIVNGLNKSFGHIECDAILMDNAKVISTPKIVACTKDANITHEASIGKIAEEEIIKLMTMGLDEKEAETTIIRGFLN